MTCADQNKNKGGFLHIGYQGTINMMSAFHAMERKSLHPRRYLYVYYAFFTSPTDILV
jgi:hypothetical protein